MEDFLKRANQADDLLAKLTARVEALEKKGGAPAAVPAGDKVLVDVKNEIFCPQKYLSKNFAIFLPPKKWFYFEPNSEMMTEKARIKIRGMVMQLKVIFSCEKRNFLFTIP